MLSDSCMLATLVLYAKKVYAPGAAHFQLLD